jgi:hypothetical protein
VGGAAVLHEVRTFVEVLVDGDAKLVGRQVEQLFARALSDEVHHLLVEIGRRRGVREERRLRSAPADDVAGDQHARSQQFAVRDRVANDDERQQRAVAVTHGGNSVLELRLRRLDDDVEEAVLVAHHRFAVVVQRQMHVGVDETRRDVLAGGVDDARVLRNGDLRSRADGDDALAADDDDTVGNRRAAVSVDERAADDGNDWIRWECRGGSGLAGGRRGGEGESGEQKNRA